MGLPRQYRKGARRLASYAYVDLITGRSYGTTYVGTTDLGNTHIMSFETFKGFIESQAEFGAGGAADYVLDDDKDYDIDVNRTFVLQGQVLVTTTIGTYGTGANQMYFKVIYKLRKYDGTTETTLATSGNYIENSSNGNDDASRVTMTMDVTTPTIFQAGDKLRLTVEVYTKGDGGGLYTKSPTNQTIGNAQMPSVDDHDSTFTILLPFRVFD